MATMRCPKHDHIFETSTDHRKPGFVQKAKFEGDADILVHPHDGHPDCEKCQADAEEKRSSTPTVKVPGLAAFEQRHERTSGFQVIGSGR